MPKSRLRSRRAPRRAAKYYLLPLGISIGIVVLVTVLFNVYTYFQAQQEQALKSEPIAQINIDNDNTSVIFNNERTKLFRGYTIDWNNGEGLETGENAQLSVVLATRDVMRLDSNSTVFAKRDEGRSIVLGFNKGNLWVRSDTPKSANDATVVRMNTMRFALTGKTTVAIADNELEETVAVVEGQLPLEILDAQGKVLREMKIGVGQQIRLTPQMVANSSDSTIEAIPATASQGEWFKWNTAQDAAMASYEGTEEGTVINAENPNVITFKNVASTFRSKTIRLEGTFDPAEVEEIFINGTAAVLNTDAKTWTLTQLVLADTGKNTLDITYTRPDGTEVSYGQREVTVDEAGPETPVLSSPSNTNVSTANVPLKGTVGPEAKRVSVNGYMLQKFQPGSESWTYFLNAGDNMKEGANTYSVVAYDDVGNESAPLVVTINYTPSAEAPATTTTGNQNTNTAPKKTTTTPAANSTGTATQPAATSAVTPKETTPAAPAGNDGTLQPANIRPATGTGSGL